VVVLLILVNLLVFKLIKILNSLTVVTAKLIQVVYSETAIHSIIPANLTVSLVHLMDNIKMDALVVPILNVFQVTVISIQTLALLNVVL
jgi:hypothetical protein